MICCEQSIEFYGIIKLGVETKGLFVRHPYYIYMNNSVPLSEVVSTLSVWIGNLVRLHKSIHICYVFLSRVTVIILV